jgi:hypothetical protein
MPETAGIQGEHQPGANEERKLEAGRAPPIGKRFVDRLNERKLRVGLWHIADGDDGIGVVRKSDLENAGVSAENGQRLLRPENCQQVSGSAVERRASLYIAVAIGKQHRAPIRRSAFRQARSKRSLPAGIGLQSLVLEIQRSDIGHQSESVAGRIELGASAVENLKDEADQDDAD